MTISLANAARSVVAELEQLNNSQANADLSKDQRLRCISRSAAELLHLLVLATQPERVLELGTSSGYSAIWLGSAAALYGGTVTTVEIDAVRPRRARHNLARAGLSTTVDVVDDDALAFARSVTETFGFVFIDLSSSLYVPLFSALRNKIAPGGMIFVDGWTVLANWEREKTLVAYRDLVDAVPDFASALIPLEKGYLLAVREPES